MHTQRRTGETHPKSNYELFNCNNLNIRYWSWNYRGCWPLRPLRAVSAVGASHLATKQLAAAHTGAGLAPEHFLSGARAWRLDPPRALRESVSTARGALSHRAGLARTSNRLQARCTERGPGGGRCLSVRYDGSAEVSLPPARHGIGPTPRSPRLGTGGREGLPRSRSSRRQPTESAGLLD